METFGRDSIVALMSTIMRVGVHMRVGVTYDVLLVGLLYIYCQDLYIDVLHDRIWKFGVMLLGDGYFLLWSQDYFIFNI